MGIFFVYILKTSVCLAVFYLFYRLLLSKETFHRFNRMALLDVLVLSCFIPLIEVTTHEPSEVSQPFLSLEEMMLMAEAAPVALAETSVPFPWRSLLLLVYLMGILFFLVRHLWSLGKMVRLLRSSRKECLKEGITLFIHDEKEVAPFSWMKNIAISASDLEESGDEILTHERAHIRNRHSWDLLLAEVCIFFQWFNPAAWLLKQELQTIHEFEADEWVIENGIDAKRYQLLLIKKVVGARLYSIANSFNHSSLKKRITMMIKKKSNPWARLKYLYVLPLTAVAVAAFARPEVSNELDEISNAKVNDLVSVVETEETKSVEKSSDEKFKVSGAVFEYTSKKPVPGASIVLRGTTSGTLTDKDGNFSLMAKNGDVLVVSYIGLQTQMVPVKFDGRTEGNIKLGIAMRDDVQSMEEMVVVGSAPQEKEQPVKYTEVKVEEAEAEQKEEVIFQVVEEMPEFPGGMAEAMKFLGQNIKYPVAAQQAKIEGRVIVRFVVKRDGSVSDVEVMRGVSPELDAEAVRVVSMMPKWNPGKQRGKAVSVKFTMPIMFRLQTPASEPKKEDAASYQHINLKVGKDADMANVDKVKNYLKVRDKGNYLEYEMKFDEGVNKKVEKLPSGGVGYHSDHSITMRVENGKHPLIVVDGKELGNGMDVLKQIPVDQIEAIELMRNGEASVQYGDKAKDGVIKIATKKK